MMFVGFLGCYGAIQESQCLLGTVSQRVRGQGWAAAFCWPRKWVVGLEIRTDPGAVVQASDVALGASPGPRHRALGSLSLFSIISVLWFSCLVLKSNPTVVDFHDVWIHKANFQRGLFPFSKKATNTIAINASLRVPEDTSHWQKLRPRCAIQGLASLGEANLPLPTVGESEAYFIFPSPWGEGERVRGGGIRAAVTTEPQAMSLLQSAGHVCLA
jgi:hypothetical protein